MAADLLFDDFHLVTPVVCSRLLLLDAAGSSHDGLCCKLLEQGQFSDSFDSLYSIGPDTFQVIQNCKNW